MKIPKNLILLSICLLLTQPSLLFSINDIVVDAWLYEPSSVQKTAKEITSILNQLGLDTGHPGELTPNTVKEKLTPQIPTDLELFKTFIEQVPQSNEIKQASKDIKKLCNEKLNKPDLLNAQQIAIISNIITHFFIHSVRTQLIYHYTSTQPTLSKEETESLLLQILGMCTCNEAPLAKRFILILNCVEQLRKSTPTTEHIIITSLGSDRLLMEYLLIKTLKAAGYQSITLNAIDQVYRSIEKPDDSMVGLVKTFSNRTELAINICVQGKSANARLNAINVFDSPYDYEHACQTNPSLKSTIMIAVDPSMGGESALFAQPFKGTEKKELRAGINRVDIFLENRAWDSFDVTIYLPRHGTPRIYWDRLIFFDPEEQEKIEHKITNTENAFPEPRAQNVQAYDAALVQKIIETATAAILEGDQYLIGERTRKKLAKQDLSEEIREKIIKRRIAQSTRDIAKNKVKVEYKRDPYIVLEDLAMDCLKPEGFGYMLGVNKLIFFNLQFLNAAGSYSLYEKFGDNERRCILRSPEFIEQQLQ
jgi:hypothetical protein